MRRADATIVGTVTGRRPPARRRQRRAVRRRDEPDDGDGVDAQRRVHVHRRRAGQLHADRRGAGLRPADRAGPGRRRRRADPRRGARGGALMHVTALPMLVELPVGQPAQIAVTITNTSVDHRRLHGAGVRARPAVAARRPAAACRCSPPRSASSRSPSPCRRTSRPGMRNIAVHVQSENDPTEFTLAQIALDVGTRSRTTLRVDPVTVTGGNSAQFALVVANEGNATVQARPMGVDPEDVVDIDFEPPTVVLPPGRREVVRADVRGGRPWFGQPKPRVLSFSLGPDSPPAMATFVQRPRIGRWLISLLGLVTVAGIFALVLSTVADRLVDEAGVDDALLNEALTQPGAGGGEAVSVTPSVGHRQGRRGQHRAGRRRCAGRAVLVGQRRRRRWPRAATDALGRLHVRPPAGRPLPAALHRCRVRRAVVQGVADVRRRHRRRGRRRRHRGARGPRARRSTGQHRRRGRSSPTRRAPSPGSSCPVLADDGHERARRARSSVSADGAFLFEDVPSPATLPADRRQGGVRHRGPRRRAAAPPRTSRASRSSCARATVSSSGRVQSPSGPLGGVDGDGDRWRHRGVDRQPDARRRRLLRRAHAADARAVHADVRARGLRVGDPHGRPGRRPAGRRASPSTLAPTTGVDLRHRQPRRPRAGRRGHRHRDRPRRRAVDDDGERRRRRAATSSTACPVPATYTITFSKPGLVSQTRLEDLDPLAGRAIVTGIDARMVSSTAIVRGTVRAAGGAPVAGRRRRSSTTAPRRATCSRPTTRSGVSSSPASSPAPTRLTASLPGTSPAVLLVNVIAADVVDLAVEPRAAGVAVRPGARARPGRPGSSCRSPVPGDADGTPCGAVVRLFAAEDFPGLPSQALAHGRHGRQRRLHVRRPGGARTTSSSSVYVDATAVDPLDSVLVQTQPSRPPRCPTFQIRQAT